MTEKFTWRPENEDEARGAVVVEAINNAIATGRVLDTDFIQQDLKTGKIVTMATMTDAAHERMLKRTREYLWYQANTYGLTNR